MIGAINSIAQRPFSISIAFQIERRDMEEDGRRKRSLRLPLAAKHTKLDQMQAHHGPSFRIYIDDEHHQFA